MNSETINNLLDSAFKHFQAGELNLAEDICKNIIQNRPNDVDALHLLGIINHEFGHLDIAIKYLDKVVQIDPAFPDAYNNLGNILQEKGQIDEAIKYYLKALALNPNLSKTYYNLGFALQEKGRVDEAISHYQKALELNFNTFGIHNNLGLALQETGQLDKAISTFQKALQLNPDFAEAYYNIGNTLRDKGKFDESITYYQKALEKKPDYIEAHWNRALLLLLTGDFRQGWGEYEWRWKLKNHFQYNYIKPLWDGSGISGLTILLHAEQGFGDTIQFIRYADLVAKRGAKVIIECQKELVSLLQTVDGVYQVKAYSEPLPYFDVHCPLLSLPLIFDTTSETIPSKIPYITPEPGLTQKWKDKIQHENSKYKIGLAWSGNSKHKNESIRSFSLDIFLPLAQCKNITFYSLQKGEAAAQATNPPEGIHLIDFMEDIIDFSDTAALIDNLDLVISVDTSVAHIAGALGKPVWILLPFVPDWRWLLHREDSPWYPTMRLFRQQTPGDWDSVIAVVKDKLSFLDIHSDVLNK
jgi:tetratricopeptide (TPR) repeat protein